MRDAAGVSTVVPGWPVAFRGSLAVRAGLTTWGCLRGPRFERLFPDVYCPTGDEPPDLRLRSLGAYRLVEGRGVLAGYSAAVLLDADCARYRDVPAEVTVAGGGQRVHDGLVVRRERIAPGETTWVDGVRCTSPLRTAYDLGRQEDLVEAVVAVDRLSNRHCFSPDLLLHFGAHYRGGPGTGRLCTTLAYANPYAGSPMEPRLRLIIVQAGPADPAGAVGGAGRRGPHGRLARPGLAGAPHRHRVRGRGTRSATPGATPGSSTAAGGSTATPGSTSTAIPGASSPN